MSARWLGGSMLFFLPFLFCHQWVLVLGHRTALSTLAISSFDDIFYSSLELDPPIERGALRTLPTEYSVILTNIIVIIHFMVLRLGTANFEKLSLPLHMCFLSRFSIAHFWRQPFNIRSLFLSCLLPQFV
ncbi:uncharacterized protein P174DRAFT_139948 [Aspergillus novofumigatus IBT 16806]|uniref:Secreted protein n=1 Tax=Aspergillus novofumigatus (strain IBT 16806) TaxID=1392255 RepID=A0A2I1CDK3_ASPN1|nr:uncharacterized protein P174DRAFT_139948 [Aspergillus novofumigatus IBT 16806]PKX95694.1 hypothetical protein P174DRAFT_139948 [Aspergillus novofumigatus IBT 16806]